MESGTTSTVIVGTRDVRPGLQRPALPPLVLPTEDPLQEKARKPCRFREKPCQFPCIKVHFFAIFTSYTIHVSDHVNMSQLGRRNSPSPKL